MTKKKKKIDKSDLIKFKTFMPQRTSSKNEKTTQRMGENIVSKIHHELLQLNSKANNPILKIGKGKKKWTKDLYRLFFKEDTHVVHKYMKRCSVLPVIREMQIKTTTRHQFLFTWIVII